MNNEKQHSEYKIIETVATPTFDGISVETHPEDQLGGGDTPEPTPIALCIDQTPHDEQYVIGTLYDGVFRVFALKEAPTWAAKVNHVRAVSGEDRINTLDDYTNMLRNRGMICSYSELSGTIAFGSVVDNWDEYEIV